MITGASLGIGFAIAERLMDEGCEVRLVARDAARLEAACAKLAPRHRGEIRLVAADLADVDDAKRAFPLLEGADILVNSAGAVPRGTVLAPRVLCERYGVHSRRRDAIPGVMPIRRRYPDQMNIVPGSSPSVTRP